MKLQWSKSSLKDLSRLYDFLAPVNNSAATKVIRAITKAPDILHTNPRIGEQLFQFLPREVRRLLVSNYEIRYEITNANIYTLIHKRHLAGSWSRLHINCMSWWERGR